MKQYKNTQKRRAIQTLLCCTLSFSPAYLDKCARIASPFSKSHAPTFRAVRFHGRLGLRGLSLPRTSAKSAVATHSHKSFQALWLPRSVAEILLRATPPHFDGLWWIDLERLVARSIYLVSPGNSWLFLAAILARCRRPSRFCIWNKDSRVSFRSSARRSWEIYVLGVSAQRYSQSRYPVCSIPQWAPLDDRLYSWFWGKCWYLMSGTSTKACCWNAGAESCHDRPTDELSGSGRRWRRRSDIGTFKGEGEKAL